MTGATMQPEFNKTIDKQAPPTYLRPPSAGVAQDTLRQGDDASSKDKKGD